MSGGTAQRPFGTVVESAFEALCDTDADGWETALAGLSDRDRDLTLRLLSADRAAGTLLDRGLAGLDPSSVLVDALPGSSVDGRWAIGDRIGSGGMANVYRAHSMSRPEDEVALKVLHVGSSLHRARFDQEREILADLEHPGIVRWRGGGVLPDGRPYLVMDYVDGWSLDVYCREHESTVREAARLGIELCRALEYAHSRLVLHQDLKPSNVLVDREGSVHLLDFGIARILETAALATSTGERFVTPGYTSPERVLGRPATTASDVFSLGVVLYELLAGRHPFRRPDRDRSAVLTAVLDGNVRAASATTRSPERARELRGDLDAILGRALEVRPEHRYPTVTELRADLERYLEHRPVSARRGRRLHAARLWVQRHRALVLTSAVGLGVVVVSALSVFTAQQRALRSERTASRAYELFFDNLRALDPMRAEGAEAIRARDLLLGSVDRIRHEGALDGDVEAGALLAAARGLRNLGYSEETERVVGEVLERSDLGTGVRRWALLLQGDVALARGRFEVARTAVEELHELARMEAPSVRVRYEQSEIEARLLAAEGDREGAHALLQSLAGELEELPPDTVAEWTAQVAELAGPDGAGDAVSKTREAWELVRRHLGESHPATFDRREDHAVQLMRAGFAREAERELELVLDARRARLGVDHPSVGSTLHNLGVAQSNLGNWRGSTETLRAAEDLLAERLGAYSPFTVETKLALARRLFWTGELSAARDEACDAFAGRVEHSASGGWIAGAALECGQYALLLGELEEAATVLATGLAAIAGRSGEVEDRLRLAIRGGLAQVAAARGDLEVADGVLREASEEALLVPGAAAILLDARLDRDWARRDLDSARERLEPLVAGRLKGDVSPLDLWRAQEVAELRLVAGDVPAALSLAEETAARAENLLGSEAPVAVRARAVAVRARLVTDGADRSQGQALAALGSLPGALSRLRWLEAGGT